MKPTFQNKFNNNVLPIFLNRMQKIFQIIFEHETTLVQVRFKEVTSIYLQLKT
jgi:deoxycytidine triphosphate deaminase